MKKNKCIQPKTMRRKHRWFASTENIKCKYLQYVLVYVLYALQQCAITTVFISTTSGHLNK